MNYIERKQNNHKYKLIMSCFCTNCVHLNVSIKTLLKINLVNYCHLRTRSKFSYKYYVNFIVIEKYFKYL